MSTSATPVAFVTGAARGIGLAIARWFFHQGYRVAVIDNDAPTLTATEATLRSELGTRSSDLLVIHGDVADPSQVASAVQRIEQGFGRLDALVNNAGVATFKPIGETTFDEWRWVMATNLDGPFLCVQACAPLMLKNGGGAVVNIASISGLRASTLRVAYGTSKAALIHLTRQQAVEYGNAGIRVNAIAPGPVETEMAKKVHTPAIRADYHDTIPLARYGSLEEIANAVGFLCSPQASYVNGQVLAVDGGFDAAGVGLPTLRRPAP